MEYYDSKYTGAETDNLLDKVANGDVNTDAIRELNNKVDKRPGKNLFNKNSNNHIYGKYISLLNYELENDLYLISEYIQVKPSTDYCFSVPNEAVGCAMYDKDYNYLQVVPVANFRTTADTYYIRFSQLVSKVGSQQLEEGTSPTAYEAYTDFAIEIKDGSIGPKKIQDKAVSLSKLSFTTSGKNLANLNDENVAIGYYVYNGALTSSSTYNTTGYIPVEEGAEYVLSDNGALHYARFIDFYNDQRQVVSYTANVTHITIPAGVKYVRISVINTAWPHFQIEKGTTPTPYEAFASYIDGQYIGNITIGNEEIGTSQLKEMAVTPNKTSFFKQGKNLVDVDSSNILYGQYLDAKDTPMANSSYNTTDYIPVVPGKKYVIGASDKEEMPARIISTYDKNYKITSNYYANLYSIVIPEGVSYIRAALYTTSWDYAQISEGESRVPYEKYAVVKSEYLPNIAAGATDIDIYVPKDIYVAAGRTIELYYEQMVLNAHRYNIQATCSIGKALDRKFQIIGDDDKIGDYQLTINVYNDSAALVGSGTGTIHIVSNISNAVNIVPFGDSLTNDKPWLAEVESLSNSKINMVGTRHNQHEGRSGANVSLYLDKTGGLLYNYDNFYSGVGVDAPIFSASASYNKGDIVRYPATFGTGATGYHVYAFKTAHSGAWNTLDVVCISGGNPLYDYNNNKISLDFYKDFQGLSVDAIILYLGTNSINLSPENNMNGALGIRTLIDEIRQEDATTPIIVVNTIFRSSQNGIGNQGNTDGYKAQAAYKFEEDRKVLLLAKSLGEMLDGYDRVYIAPVGFTHDSKYNFGNTKVAVNPRLEVTETVYELMPSDSVHPQTSGYYQMADTIYSTICAVVSKSEMGG